MPTGALELNTNILVELMRLLFRMDNNLTVFPADATIRAMQKHNTVRFPFPASVRDQLQLTNRIHRALRAIRLDAMMMTPALALIATSQILREAFRLSTVERMSKRQMRPANFRILCG